MKEYIKPQFELIEYSFEDIIAAGSVEKDEGELPDVDTNYTEQNTDPPIMDDDFFS